MTGRSSRLRISSISPRLHSSGFAFGLAYPRRLVLIASLVLISAFGLEAMQLLTPDRHGRLIDAAIKAAGGVCGIGISQLALLVLRAQTSRAS